MANGSVIALKLILKGFGVDVVDLENKINQVVAVIQEFDLNELRAALKMVLDYKTHQAQNELRMKAIMARLDIPDPVMVHETVNVLQHEKETSDG